MKYRYITYNVLITLLFFLLWNNDSESYDSVKLFTAFMLLDGLIIFFTPRISGNYFNITYNICKTESRTKIILFIIFLVVNIGTVLIISFIHYILTLCTLSDLTAWCCAILFIGWVSQHYSPNSKYI